MPDWLLLLPIVFPIISTPAFVILSPRLTSSSRRVTTLSWLGIEIALLLLSATAESHRLVFSTWERAALIFALQLDGMTLLVALALLVLLWVRELIIPTRFDALTFAVLGFALGLAMADGVPMTLVAWTLLDLALFAGGWHAETERAAWRRLALGLLMALVFLAGALTQNAALLALALWARLGLFPFHALVPPPRADESDGWLMRAVPPLVATMVWLRWHTQVSAAYTIIGVLTGANLLVAALWIWRARDIYDAWHIGTMHAWAFVPLALVFSGEVGRALALWQIVAMMFAFVLGEMAQRWRVRTFWITPYRVGIIALVTLAGLPLTPAFLGRASTYVALAERHEWLLLLLIVMTTWSVFTPLWYWMRASEASSARALMPHEYVGWFVVFGAFAVLALTPLFLAPMLNIAEATTYALEEWLLRNPFDFMVAISVLVLPLVGASVAHARMAPSPRLSAMLAWTRWLDGEWLERACIRCGTRLGIVLRDVFALTEENPTVWILFVALWVAIFIALAR